MVYGEVVGLKNGELVMAARLVYLREIVKIGWLAGCYGSAAILHCIR